MEANSKHVNFRSRIILCFNDEKTKLKTCPKTIASWNILFINAIVCY